MLLVTPRPPRSDGRGDQRRADEILRALSVEWDVDVLSWLPDVDLEGARIRIAGAGSLMRGICLAMVRPLQVAYVQSRTPRSIRRRLESAPGRQVLFVTNRAVPLSVQSGFVMDFVDDLGGAAMRRARHTSWPVSLFWRWEGWRLRRLDHKLVQNAGLSIAHGSVDASGISPDVRVIPLSIGTTPMPMEGNKVLFSGNLFYEPNHEAATWMCEELCPSLQALGVEPGRVIIAGRRPRPSLEKSASDAGVDFRPDVDDLADVFREASVVIAPMLLGSGAQYKILDAIGAGRPCVLSPRANGGLGLVDGQSALVRERRAEDFARAVADLLDDPVLGQDLVRQARLHVRDFFPEAVAAEWRAAISLVQQR